jgi:hypothetical protein
LPGYEPLRGELTPARTRQTLMADDPLECRNAFDGVMAVRAGDAEYWLARGVTCTGDRSGLCCPYASGTPVRILRRAPKQPPVQADADTRRAAAAMATLLDDYWICQDGDPPSSPAARPMPVVVDTTPATRPGRLAYPERPRGLAFWFGERYAVWDPVGGSIATIGAKGGAPLACVAVGPGGKRAFTIDASGAGALWDVAAGARLDTVAGIAPEGFPDRVEPDAACAGFLLRDLTWSADGGHLFVVSNDGRALLWETEHAARRGWSVDADRYSFAALSADGARLTIVAPPRVAVHSTTAERPVAELPARFATLSRDGTALLASGELPTLDASVQLFRIDDGGATLKANGSGCRAAFSASGRLWSFQSACAPDPGRTRILETASGKPLVDVAGARLGVWSPVEDTFAAWTPRGLEAWTEKAGWRLLAPRDAGGDPPLEFSPDGKQIVAGARLVHMQPAHAVILRGFGLLGTTVAFSPGGGAFLAVGGVSTGSAFEPTAAADVHVVDTRNGCETWASQVRTDRAPHRYGLVGATSVHWLSETDTLVVPAIDTETAVQLVRPGTGASLFATAVDTGSGVVPLVFDDAGHFDVPVGKLEAGAVTGHAEWREQRHGMLQSFLAAKSIRGLSTHCEEKP